MQAWQQEFERYVSEQGGGNLAVVRHLTTDPVHTQFGIFGDRQGVIGPQRTDVNSVIVGHRRVEERYWLLFVVATIHQAGGVVDVQFDQPSVVDLRAAAVTRRGEGFHWIVSEPNDTQLAAYLAVQQADWRASHPDRADKPVAFTRFPTDKDRYELAIEGRRARITEARSGATWELTLTTAADDRLAEQD